MQFLKNTSKILSAILIFLMIASITLLAMPLVSVGAQEEGGNHGIVGGVGTTTSNIYGYPHLGPLPSGVTPFTTIYTLAYMSINPDPIGVGQQVLVNVWVSPGMPNWMYMQGLKVTIQAPVLATSAFSLGVSAGFDGWVFVVLAAILDAPVLLVYVLEKVTTE